MSNARDLFLMNSPTPSLPTSNKSEAVRAMFSQIAPKYDFLNHALSLNVDRRWRRFVVAKVRERLEKPGALALDLCCGTGDLAIAIAAVSDTIGVDFCKPMLEIGADKIRGAQVPVVLVEGDALRVPVCDATVDVVTMAFGLRNLDGIDRGLQEMFRVLKPGGRAAVLEFSQPRIPIFRNLFRYYFSRVLPRVGNAISGSEYAYRYLPESVERFPDQVMLQKLMRSAGFSSVNYYNLFGGVAALHIAEKQ
jgi:demethylmenaquinone methyltransferase/2-methoxy-6-polyprenyl-1,4-benzoquinol methylase